ncbi:MAG: signal peptide peptidase SppA [Bacteroidales bacterium]
MKNFLIYTLATITGIILSSFIFFLIFIGSLGALIAAGEKPVQLSGKNILVLNAGVPIPDRTNPDPWAGFDILNMSFSPAPGLNDILKNIKKAQHDPAITGIFIENGLLPSGWATATEIRDALLKFRECGKFVLAYSDYVLTQEGYYLSTSADRIYINPESTIEFKGLSGEVMFYKDALEKLGVEVQVVRHGKFKGAVEPYVLNGLSKENREQIEAYVGSVWKYVLESISAARNIPVDKLNRLADELAAFNPQSAVENGLIDGFLYRDELIDTIKIWSGLKTTDKIGLVSMMKYTKVPDTDKKSLSKNKISIIFAEGTIVTGKGNPTNIGGNYYADIIREQRKDSTVKAIVLRVNSPGGNAIASEVIWREVALAAASKPVVVSMGNYAASGGYYISAPATRIVASPVTISGSIGVFGLVPNTEKLMKNKLGINTETVNTNKWSDFPSVFRPMSTYEKEVMQKNIENTYNEFTRKVSEGRKIALERVLEIGEGRVWEGVSALNLGLIDEFEGLEKSISVAASLANIKEYSIKEYPEREDPYKRLIAQLTGDVRLKTAIRKFGETARILEQLNEIQTMTGIQARMPYLIDIH